MVPLRYPCKSKPCCVKMYISLVNKREKPVLKGESLRQRQKIWHYLHDSAFFLMGESTSNLKGSVNGFYIRKYKNHGTVQPCVPTTFPRGPSYRLSNYGIRASQTFLIFFDPCGRRGRFYGVADRRGGDTHHQ